MSKSFSVRRKYSRCHRHIDYKGPVVGRGVGAVIIWTTSPMLRDVSLISFLEKRAPIIESFLIYSETIFPPHRSFVHSFVLYDHVTTTKKGFLHHSSTPFQYACDTGT